MKVYIRSNQHGDISVHRSHRPLCKGDRLEHHVNRLGENVYEYHNSCGLSTSFIEVELKD